MGKYETRHKARKCRLCTTRQICLVVHVLEIIFCDSCHLLCFFQNRHSFFLHKTLKKAEKIQRFQRFLANPHKRWIFLKSGLDGSRTRVRSTIPCPSTSVVCYLTFPLPVENKHPPGFSSFMIRPHAQSLTCVVSHIVEAWVLKCECSRSDCCH